VQVKRFVKSAKSYTLNVFHFFTILSALLLKSNTSDSDMASRSNKSGATKRKLRDEKQEKGKIKKTKLRKLTIFFPGKPSLDSTRCDDPKAVSPSIVSLAAGLSDDPEAVSPSIIQLSVSTEPEAVSPPVISSPSLPREFSTDPILWPNDSPHLRRYWSGCGPLTCQNHNTDFRISARQIGQKVRRCFKDLFFRKFVNGQKICRECLLVSPSTDKVVCFAYSFLVMARAVSLMISMIGLMEQNA
jgi:hypothetical protein